MVKATVRVLMVDDDEDEFVLVQSLAMGQQARSWTMDWEPDAQRALNHMTAGDYDVYLVDYRLGAVNGLELINKALKAGADAPMIMLTGQGMDDLDEQALTQGAADYLDKQSLTGPTLARSIRYALARQQDRAQIRLQERAIQATNTGICIAEVDSEGQYPVTFINPAFTRITGYQQEDILGQNCRILQGGDRDQPGLTEVRTALEKRRACRVVIRNYRKSGDMFWNELSLTPIWRNGGQVTHFVATQQDVTRQKHAEIQASMAQNQLQLQVTHDRLTGLPNRYLFEDRLKQAMALAQRSSEGLAVIAVDMDQFAALNDNLGFDAGDEALRLIADRTQKHLRSTDTLSRDNGDEFLLLIPGLNSPDEIPVLCRKLNQLISERVRVQGKSIRLTGSLGAAWHERAEDTPSDLIRQAKQAVKQAKRMGRNNFVVYAAEDDVPKTQHPGLSNQFQDAIANQEFLLHFQPQVSSLQQQVQGVEALVRWRHPELGLLSPGQFIHVAEDSGHIVALGKWILHAACRQNRQWLDAGLVDFPVAVNVSALQFSNDDFVTTVADALADTGLPARNLELELTESMMLTTVDVVIERLNALKSLGVRLSIDDFGTGYSSLAYLKRLPIDQLKIDRAFVTDLSRSQDDAAIVRAIINLAHNLRLTVIAEGVETREQLNYLSRHGCDQVQGYLISPPMEPEGVEEFIRLQRRGVPKTDLQQTATLLLVDDEENILRSLQRVLRHEGYRILTASTGEKALELVESEPVNVILTDQAMPGMSGVDLLHQVRHLYPDIVRLVLTGYTDVATVTRAINESSVFKFIAKPWDDDDLRATIRQAFELEASTNS